MSGHSKWSTIKRAKAAQDAKKSGAFTKLSRMITVAVRTGGSADPDTNFKLRLAIDAAKSASVPKDTIERAMQRGLGVGSGDSIEEIVYEGFGTAGVAFIIETATDNKNRTVNEVKKVFRDFGGSLGVSNSTAWMFDHIGRIVVAEELSEDEQLELFDAGVLDMEVNEGHTIIDVSKDALKSVQEKIGKTTEQASLIYNPQNIIPVSEEETEKVIACADALDALDDVQSVYHNADV